MLWIWGDSRDLQLRGHSAVRSQARFYPGAGSCADGSDLIWKMLQILEKGDERDWVVTIVKVCSSLHMHTCSRHRSDWSAIPM